MFRYEFICPGCARTLTVERTVEDRNVPPACPDCQLPMKRVYTPPAGFIGASDWRRPPDKQ